MKEYMQEFLEAPLRLHKLKLECLQKRMALMPEGKTDYEKNEAILAKIETGAQIKALLNVIAEREAYYIQYWQKEFLPTIEDMEENFSKVIAQASKREEPEIKELLAKVSFQVVGSVNIEGKMFEYKRLKNLLAKPPANITKP